MDNQSHLLDRIWLEQIYLPSLKGRTLFVGVSFYTSFYQELVKDKDKFITVDPELAVAKYGSKSEHYMMTAEDFFNINNKLFDNISLNGLFGMSHLKIQTMKEFLNLMQISWNNLEINGTLQVGVNIEMFTEQEMEENLFLPFLKEKKYEIIENTKIKPSFVHSEMKIYWFKKK